MPKTVLSIIHEGETIEIQWGEKEPVEGRIKGYVQIVDGMLCVPFRDRLDRPFVFVLSENEATVYRTEDVPPSMNADVAWTALLDR